MKRSKNSGQVRMSCSWSPMKVFNGARARACRRSRSSSRALASSSLQAASAMRVSSTVKPMSKKRCKRGVGLTFPIGEPDRRQVRSAAVLLEALPGKGYPGIVSNSSPPRDKE